MSGIRDYFPAAVLLVFSVVWVGALTVWPRAGQPVAALYPSAAGDGFVRAVDAGAEAVLGFGALPGVVVVQAQSPDLVDRLYESGALVVVRAPARGDCLR